MQKHIRNSSPGDRDEWPGNEAICDLEIQYIRECINTLW